MLKNEKFNLKFFEKERDLNIYSYFLPEVRDYIFPTFSYDKQKIKEFERQIIEYNQQQQEEAKQKELEKQAKIPKLTEQGKENI